MKDGMTKLIGQGVEGVKGIAAYEISIVDTESLFDPLVVKYLSRDCRFSVPCATNDGNRFVVKS